MLLGYYLADCSRIRTQGLAIDLELELFFGATRKTPERREGVGAAYRSRQQSFYISVVHTIYYEAAVGPATVLSGVGSGPAILQISQYCPVDKLSAGGIHSPWRKILGSV